MKQNGGEEKQASQCGAYSQRALLIKLRSLDLILGCLKDAKHLTWPDSPLDPLLRHQFGKCIEGGEIGYKETTKRATALVQKAG